MDCKEIREMYKLMFAEYPDIVNAASRGLLRA